MVQALPRALDRHPRPRSGGGAAAARPPPPDRLRPDGRVAPGPHPPPAPPVREPRPYRVRFLHSTYRGAPTLWRLLAERGLRVAAVGFPTTYPPERLPGGVMISGFDSPVTVGIDRSFVHPPELFRELNRAVGRFTITRFQEIRIGRAWHRRALTAMLDVIGLKERTACYLLRRKGPWDVFAFLFGEADTCSHHFWSFHDPESPRAVPTEDGALRQAIRTIYERLDQAVGRLVAEAGPDCHVVILSDHGFGGTGDRVLYLNRLLHHWRYLAFPPGGRGTSLLGRLKQAGLRRLPVRCQEALFRWAGGRLASLVETRSRAGAFAPEGTVAFSDELNYFPSIWLHTADRFPRGVVASGAEAEALAEELIARLEALRDPETGERLVTRVHRREELYQGPFVERAPHLILELATPGGYSLVCSPSGGRSGPFLRRLRPEEYLGAKGASMNGSHRPKGIGLIAGPGVPRGVSLERASLADWLPTILGLLGEPLPPGLDGRALVGRAALEAAPPERDREAGELESQAVEPYSPAEEAVVRRRLQELGYLE